MKRTLLVVLIVALLGLAGCTETPETPDITQPFIGGTGGLALSFPEGLPPNEIFDAGQMTFAIDVQLENVGEANIGPGRDAEFGYVEIIGINPAQFNKNDGDLRIYFSDAQMELEGAKRTFNGDIVSGDTAFVEFDNMQYVPDNYGNEEFTIRANVCYEYRTFTNTKICFKDNVLESTLDDTICTLTGAKHVAGSGGPVQVTQVTENPAGRDRIQVTFVVENIGTGQVFAPPGFQQATGNSFGQDICSFNVGANPNKDVAFVEVSLGSDSNAIIECPILGQGSSGIIRMFQGAPATVSCHIETLGAQGSRIFVDTLQVDLTYAYQEFIEKPIIVRDTNVGFVEGGIR